jgi:hypothetical protein
MASGVKQLGSLYSLLTDMPPCCLDFCREAQEYFVVGTYQLVEGSQEKDGNSASKGSDGEKIDTSGVPQQRIGSLSLYRLLQDGDVKLYVMPCFNLMLQTD